MRNPINPATYEPSTGEDEPMNRPNKYVRNQSASLLEPLGNDGMDQGSLLESYGMYGE